MGKLFDIKYENWHAVYAIFGIRFKIKRHFKNVNVLNLCFDVKAGIGNRVFGLINCIYKIKPKTIRMYWDNKEWVSAAFYDLFNFNSNLVIEEINDINLMPDCSQSKFDVTISNAPCDLKAPGGKSIGLQYNKIDENTIKYYEDIFNGIKPSVKVAKRLNAVNLPDKYNVLQVRNAPDWDNYGRNESLELFFKEIDKYPPETLFYISAMSAEISQIFKKRYGKRILELPNKDYSSMIDAIVDLFIMSKGDEAIYSYGSTFSELAWWIGGAKQKVKIVGSNNNWMKVF